MQSETVALLVGLLCLSSGCSSAEPRPEPVPDRLEVKVTQIKSDKPQLYLEASWVDTKSGDDRGLQHPSVFFGPGEPTQIYVGEADGTTVVPDPREPTGLREGRRVLNGTYVGVRCDPQLDGQLKLSLRAYLLDARGRVYRRGVVERVVASGEKVAVALESAWAPEHASETIDVTAEEPGGQKR